MYITPHLHVKKIFLNLKLKRILNFKTFQIPNFINFECVACCYHLNYFIIKF